MGPPGTRHLGLPSWDMRTYLNHFQSVLAVAFAAGLGACSSNMNSQLAEDLPTGWAGALQVSDLIQVECATGTMDFANESATFTTGASSLAVAYEEAHFRCEQDVEGFYKIANDALDILVQPIDMHPDAVAGCDCPYGITFTVKPLEAGTLQATLYRRWDGLNTPNDPVEIATAQVTIE